TLAVIRLSLLYHPPQATHREVGDGTADHVVDIDPSGYRFSRRRGRCSILAGRWSAMCPFWRRWNH
ncbi:MAG: hypothetical protein QGH20_07295, partial [Candidatus Latescibacteria bacterium]|nr:hypothetical protein [Candidatus Latescibacterota bacterium]